MRWEWRDIRKIASYNWRTENSERNAISSGMFGRVKSALVPRNRAERRANWKTRPRREWGRAVAESAIGLIEADSRLRVVGATLGNRAREAPLRIGYYQIDRSR